MKRLSELVDWKHRYDFEMTLEELTGVEPGGVIFYIPQELSEKKEPEILLKEAFVLVESKYGIENLKELGEREEFKTTIGDDIRNLESKHKTLFKASLFVSKDVMTHKMCDRLANICKDWFEELPQEHIIKTILEKEKIKIEETDEYLAKEIAVKYPTMGPRTKKPDECELRSYIEVAKSYLSEVRKSGT